MLVCAAIVSVVTLQRRELLNLRKEREARATTASRIGSEAALVVPEKSLAPSLPVSRELLQLRNQVGQLRRRRAELEPVQAEHEKLTNELAARGTNTMGLRPDYIRKSEARLVGYNSPEATLQSFLYGLRNRETNSLFQAFTTQAVSGLPGRTSEEGFDKLFEAGKSLFGLRIVSQEQSQPDYIQAKVELLPGLPPSLMNFRLVDGQWKIDSLP